MPDPDGFFEGPLSAAKMTLEKLVTETNAPTIQYLYDFGDGWDHSVSIEQIEAARDGLVYRCGSTLFSLQVWKSKERIAQASRPLSLPIVALIGIRSLMAAVKG